MKLFYVNPDGGGAKDWSTGGRLQASSQARLSLKKAAIETYLLEKSRVVQFSEGERNYRELLYLLCIV